MAVRTAMEHPIGALPRTPFPASRDFPSRGNEGYGEKNRRVIYFMYHSGVSPFGGCATTFPPQAGALQPVLNLESLMKKLPHGALFCHRLRGKSREAGKGECLSDARQGGCMVFAAKGGIKMAPKAPYLASAAILYNSRGREPSTRPGGVSRSRTEPLAPRA